MRRRLPLVISAGLLVLVAGCTAGSHNAAAVRETTQVRQAESLVADYAQTHDSGSGVGTPAGCEVRVIGQQMTGGAAKDLYVELLCSSLLGHPPCPTTNSTAFVTAAVAHFSSASNIASIVIDNDNDAEWYSWVHRHFRGQARDVEDGGPLYGKLLQSRLETQFPCP